MSLKGVLADKDAKDLLQQMLSISREKDRVKLLKAAVEESNVTCAQVIQFQETVKYGDAKVEMITICYPWLSDPENFSKILASLPFEEDRKDVKKKLNLQ